MRRKLCLIVALALTLCISHAIAAPITYSLIPVTFNNDPNFGTDMVTGTITTDGTFTSPSIPYLTTSNILAWSFNLRLGSSTTINLSDTSNGANFFVLGTALTATSRQLLFDFSGLNDEIFFSQDNRPPYPVFTEFFIETPTSNFGSLPDIREHYCTPDTCLGFTNVVHGAASVIAVAVPEPSSGAILLFGIAVIGIALHRQHRNRPMTRTLG